MKIYLVGGAVRDELLNRPVKDLDWVVVGGTPEYFLNNNYEQVGADFPVFLHPETKDEYALARKERKVGHGYNGFECVFDDTVTLKEDLYRRDLTINALAKDENNEIIDYFNGQQDLKNKVLRHVSENFKDDPLRVLRVARFMARYKEYGFSVAEETMELMKSMVKSKELNHLTAERVLLETEKALLENNPEEYFLTLKECGALEVVFPEIDKLFGVPQPPEHHPEIDTGVHTMMVLQQAKKIDPQNLNVLWGALLHDLGKGETPKEVLPQHLLHEKRGVNIIKNFATRLKMSSSNANISMLTSRYHTHVHRSFDIQPKKIWSLFKKTDAFRKPERFRDILKICEADAKGRTGLENKPYPQREFLNNILENVLNINNKNIIEKINFENIPNNEKGNTIAGNIRKAQIENISETIDITLNKDNILKKYSFLKNLNNINEKKLTTIGKLNNKDRLFQFLIDNLNMSLNDQKNINTLCKKVNSIDGKEFFDKGLRGSEIGEAIRKEKANIISEFKRKKNSKKLSKKP
tara:strand:+ start:30370 stop:31941 length:1572 start_codon:yes stop_codon:yes gene_type:complete